MASNEKLMLRRMQCSVAEENVFGPRVSPSCEDGFDFTLLFEESILTIVPVIIASLLLAVRVWKLQGIPVKINRSWLYIAKLVAISLYIVLQLVLFGFWSGTTASISATAVTAAAFTFFLYVSHLEHLRSLRPSTILNLYLFFSLLFDAIRARTLWLASGSRVAAAIFSAGCGVKSVVLILEATEKRSLLKDQYKSNVEEATGGIFSRSLFWWLNSLLWAGCKTLFTVDSLGGLDDDITAAANPQRLTQRWINGE